MNEYTEGRNLIRRIEFVFICKEDDYITEILGSATSIGVFRGGLWGGGGTLPPGFIKFYVKGRERVFKNFGWSILTSSVQTSKFILLIFLVCHVVLVIVF